jgi:hypothetical protein
VVLSGLREIYSPFHGGYVPAILEWDSILSIRPSDALAMRVKEGVLPVVEAVGFVYDTAGLPVEVLGLTGSYAGGYWHENSDVDLLVYGYENSLKMYNLFLKIRKKPDTIAKTDLGGIQVTPPVDISWRRTFIDSNLIERKIGVTWIGVPHEDIPHCKPLTSNNMKPPVKPIEILVDIERGQESALLYPPCVIDKNGIWIVSYEYNLAGLLYHGGNMILNGMASEDGGIIYLGLQEFPGRVRVLKR